MQELEYINRVMPIDGEWYHEDDIFASPSRTGMALGEVHIRVKYSVVMELSWIAAIIGGFPSAGQYGSKDVVGAKFRKAILNASVTGTAITAYGTKDRGKPKANLYLRISACPYDHCAKGMTIINYLIRYCLIKQ